MTDKEKIIRALSECSDENNAMCEKCPYNGSKGICIANMASDALAMLKEQPDIVRCKDCKWYDPLISLCDNCGLPREEMFFCADGKKVMQNERLHHPD